MARLPRILAGLLIAVPAHAQVVRSEVEGIQTEVRFDMTRFVKDSTGSTTWSPGVGVEAALGLNHAFSTFVSYSIANFDVDDEYTLVHADLGARWHLTPRSSAIVPMIQVGLAWRNADVKAGPGPSDLAPSPFRGWSGRGLSYGAGLMWYFTPRGALGTRFEYTSIGGDPLPQQPEMFTEPSARISLSLRYAMSTVGEAAPAESGDTVRIWQAAGPTRGALLGYTDDAIVLRTGTQDLRYALREIDRIERRQRRSAVRSLFVGTAAGALATVLFTSTLEDNNPHITEPVWIATGAAAGGVLGVHTASIARWQPSALPLHAALDVAVARGEQVRVRAPAYPVVIGTVTRVTADSIRVESERGSFDYARQSISRIDVKRRSSDLTIPAIAGGVVGAAAAAGIGADDLRVGHVQGVFIGGVVGAAVGAALGSVLPIGRWTTIFVR